MARQMEEGRPFSEDGQHIRRGENIEMVRARYYPDQRGREDEPKFSYKNYFKEYTSRTSLHGLQYLGEDKRHLVERIWWFIMLALSFSACVYLISKVWMKWDQSPVIVSFSEETTPVWQLPFPAITICSTSKIRPSVVNVTDYKNRYPNLTQEEIKNYNASFLVCLLDSEEELDETDVGAEDIEFIKNASPSVTDMLTSCEEEDNFGNCIQFYPSITENGQCATFNSLNFDEFYRKEQLSSYFRSELQPPKSKWSLDEGYSKKNQFNTYPIRASGSGTSAGYDITLTTKKNDYDYACSGRVRGFAVSLHTPAEYPKIEKSVFILPIGQIVAVGTKPSILSTSEILRDYHPQKRKCFFQNERRLKFFQTYSQQNCEVECLANYTTLMCGCVPYWMLRNSTTRICSAAKYECVTTAKYDLFIRAYSSDDDDDIENAKMHAVFKESAKSCNCLPSCTSITYDIETSQTNIDLDHFKTKLKDDQNEISMMTIFFKESQFLTSKRYELYGQTDFLANCGGLLGLCLGFSILSLIEIIYFLTIRFILYVREKTRTRRITPDL